MATSENRLIVVRAWQDTDRLIIRLLVSAGPQAPAREAVFTEIGPATERLAQILQELLGGGRDGRQGPRRTVDGVAAPPPHDEPRTGPEQR